jgi:adenosine kinase
MSALICGSFAYDTIMVYPGYFKNEILPDKVHMLNVSFLVPELRREFGGCAGNIAYNLRLLGGDGAPMGTVGRDFAPYADWMDRNGIRRDFLKTIEESYTAQAYITTDLDANQLTAFHPGAMNLAHTQSVPDSGITLGMVSPDGREAMIQHAREFSDRGIPFFFDPGQGMPMFDGHALKVFVEQAHYVTLNDYEYELLRERTGWDADDITSRVEALIVTGGAKGSVIYHRGRRYDIPVAAAREVVDPTGCGDAYRAGLIYGVMRGMDWETTGRVASLMGAIKIEKPGTQNHHFTPQAFAARFKGEFGYALD